MKTLTLLRHAKSGWDDSGARDFDRPLNPKGQRAAALIGRHLKSLGARFDAVIASPAMRVRQTLDHLATGYGASFSTTWDQRAYLASSATLLDLIHELPETAASALLVGHNPGLEEVVLALVAVDDDGVSLGAVAEKFPTASLAILEFDAADWAAAAPGSARLRRFTRPRDLDPTLGPDYP